MSTPPIEEGRLVYLRHAHSRATQRIFEDSVVPLLAQLGSECRLHQTYSLQKRTELVSFGGELFIVVDQAQLEMFHLLNCLSALSDDDEEFVKAALFRPVGEALRDLRQYDAAALFLSRALAAKPFLRLVQDGNPYAGQMHWQHLVLIFHEAAHAVASEHELKQALLNYSALESSMWTNERIMRSVDTVLRALDDDRPPIADGGPEPIGDDLASQEAVSEAVTSLMASGGYFDELASDLFAVNMVADQLIEEAGAGIDLAMIDDQILAIYQAFLNLRTLHHIDESCRRITLSGGAAAEPAAAVDLGAFAVLRAGFIARRIVHIFEPLLAPDQLQALNARLTSARQRQLGVVLPIANAIIDAARALLDDPAALEQELAEAAIADLLRDATSLQRSETVDSFWQMLVI